MDFASIPPPPARHTRTCELGCLFEHVAARPHAVVVEIGSLFGETLWYWSHLPAIGMLVSGNRRPVRLASHVDGVRAAARTGPSGSTCASTPSRATRHTQDLNRTLALLAASRRLPVHRRRPHIRRRAQRDWLNWSPHVRPVASSHSTTHGPNADLQASVVHWGRRAAPPLPRSSGQTHKRRAVSSLSHHLRYLTGLWLQARPINATTQQPEASRPTIRYSHRSHFATAPPPPSCRKSSS